MIPELTFPGPHARQRGAGPEGEGQVGGPDPDVHRALGQPEDPGPLPFHIREASEDLPGCVRHERGDEKEEENGREGRLREALDHPRHIGVRAFPGGVPEGHPSHGPAHQTLGGMAEPGDAVEPPASKDGPDDTFQRGTRVRGRGGVPGRDPARNRHAERMQETDHGCGPGRVLPRRHTPRETPGARPP